MAAIVLYVAATDADATAGATELERVGTRLSVVPAVELETIIERAPAADCVVFAETPTTIDGAHLLDVIDACGSTPLVLYTEAEYGPTTARATDGIAGYVRRDGDRATVHLADEIHWVCHEPEPGSSQEPIAIGPADTDTRNESTADGSHSPASDTTEETEPETTRDTPADTTVGTPPRSGAVTWAHAAQQDRFQKIERLIDHDLQNQLNLAAGYLSIAIETNNSHHINEVRAAHEGIENGLETLSELACKPALITTTEPIGLQDVARRAWARLTETDRNNRRLEHGADRVFEADKMRTIDVLEGLFREIQPADGSEDDLPIRVEPCPEGFVVASERGTIPTAAQTALHGEDTDQRRLDDGWTLLGAIVDAHNWSVSIDDDDGLEIEFTGVSTGETSLPPVLKAERAIDRRETRDWTVGLAGGDRAIDLDEEW